MCPVIEKLVIYVFVMIKIFIDNSKLKKEEVNILYIQNYKALEI